MEKYYFNEAQPRLTVGDGVVLLLINGKEETEVMDGMPNENGLATTEAVGRKVWVYDGVRLETGGMTSESALTAAAQKMVLEQIDKYDTSPSVNGFMLNGQRVWLNKDTRVGLMNGVGVAKACGMERMSLWIDGREYVMDVARLEELLVKVEVYAMGCYNVTAGHRMAVAGLTTLEAVLGYDFKAGYPQMVSVVV